MAATGLVAIVWDVDGTLAETERDGHRVAFNLAFEAFGLPWRWDERRYGELLRVAGGRERLLADMATRPDAPASPAELESLARALHARKNVLYAERLREQGVALRGGVAALIDEARERGWRQAIATTTSRSNLDALLRLHYGAQWHRSFDAVVCGEDVQRKKPDPEAHRQCLRLLALDATPQRAVAIEDSPIGVAAAHAAGLPVVLARSFYFADGEAGPAVAAGPGLDARSGWQPALPSREGEGGVTLDDIEAWCTIGQA
jgi:HAD superfamily hydrolase (TIGR01509 family)